MGNINYYIEQLQHKVLGERLPLLKFLGYVETDIKTKNDRDNYAVKNEFSITFRCVITEPNDSKISFESLLENASQALTRAVYDGLNRDLQELRILLDETRFSGRDLREKKTLLSATKLVDKILKRTGN